MNTLAYSFKIWITSVIVAPIFLVLSLFLNANSGQEGLESTFILVSEDYFVLALFELGLSFITWIMFTLAIYLVVQLRYKIKTKRVVTLIIGIIFTVGTCVFMLAQFGLFDSISDIEFSAIIMTGNCLCIGFGVLYYKFPLTHSTDLTT